MSFSLTIELTYSSQLPRLPHYTEHHNPKQRFSTSDGLAMGNILCGNGSAELIWAIALTFLKVGDKAAIPGPTFGEYRAASLQAGAEVVEYRQSESDNFQLNLSEFCQWLQQERPTLIWLCNPNNPTGQQLCPNELARILNIALSVGAKLVIDEA